MRKIPGSQAVVVAGAKHSVHGTHPEQVSQAVLASYEHAAYWQKQTRNRLAGLDRSGGLSL